MSSPEASTDSERDGYFKWTIVAIDFKNESGISRIQIKYGDDMKEIIKDPCKSRFGDLLLSDEGSPYRRGLARESLEEFSKFLYENKVEVSHGLRGYNMLCEAERNCGIEAPHGLLFAPHKDIEFYGNMASSPEEHGYYKVHITFPIVDENKEITNRIKLRKGTMYLIGGFPDASSQCNKKAPCAPRPECECEQCLEDGWTIDLEGLTLTRELEEAVINPLEILSQRYQSAQVAGMAVWPSKSRALVCRDRDGTYRIKSYLASDAYSEVICEDCKSKGRIARCPNHCREIVRVPGEGIKPPDIDIVEPGNAAVLGNILYFCPVKYMKVLRSLESACYLLTRRPDSFEVRQGGSVLKTLANAVRATPAEVVFVLNNDTSLVQPIIRGSNCFLRRDSRGQWDSCDKLTGSELHKQIFHVDETGTWIMIGTGEKYGVSSTGGGNYHLEPGAERMKYGPHLDSQLFGGPVVQ